MMENNKSLFVCALTVLSFLMLNVMDVSAQEDVGSGDSEEEFTLEDVVVLPPRGVA